jgi:hypothetical protein
MKHVVVSPVITNTCGLTLTSLFSQDGLFPIYCYAVGTLRHLVNPSGAIHLSGAQGSKRRQEGERGHYGATYLSELAPCSYGKRENASYT